MTRDDLLSALRLNPLIASVQASPGAAVDDPETLRRLGQCSADQGVKVLRLQGVENIRAIRGGTGLPSIGLIKRDYSDSEVYITPTLREVDEVIDAGAEVVALDATARPRPRGVSLKDLVSHAHQAGRLVLADIDSLESAQYAVQAGCDFISTTLAGYTKEHPATTGPDIELLRQVVNQVAAPVFAEGRISQRWHVETALRIGATGVIVGGALNDPVKQTRALTPHHIDPKAQIGAIDIGGTWFRFGRFSPDWELIEATRTPNPAKREDRIAWIRAQVESSGVKRLGVSTGGVVDPKTGEVWAAKEYLMPDHVGIFFDEATLGIPTYAHGDGHATAWAHACLPDFAGLRVATLALGTGVGCGFVQEGRLWTGPRGEYPRINDLPSPLGKSYEDLLGGRNLTSNPSEEDMAAAITALDGAMMTMQHLYFPDVIVVAGGVGLCPWLKPHVERLGGILSPLGPDAGLYGAAALALYPA